MYVAPILKQMLSVIQPQPLKSFPAGALLDSDEENDIAENGLIEDESGSDAIESDDEFGSNLEANVLGSDEEPAELPIEIKSRKLDKARYIESIYSLKSNLFKNFVKRLVKALESLCK